MMAGVALFLAGAAAAQQPTVTRPVEDTVRARQLADSLAIVRELEADRQPPPAQQAPVQGASRLLPDISAVGDLLADLSPDRSTQEDASRFAVREVEIAFQAAVDPYFRGDVFLGFNDAEGAAVEQAFLTTTSLPWSAQLRLGRFLLPFGKQNTTHRHDLHTIEYPYVLQRLLGPEGLKGTGIEASRIGAPFGFYQELLFTAVNDLADEAAAELHPLEPASRRLNGLGFTTRLRNYWDFSAATNLELSFSAATGRVPVALDGTRNDDSPADVDAVNARRSLLGVDLTFRWRPLQQGLYRSFLLNAELLRQLNQRHPGIPAGLAGASLALPQHDYTGAYLFARWQLTRRTFLGGRADWLQDPTLTAPAGAMHTLRAGSLYWEFFPSEFSKLNVGFERLWPGDGSSLNRLLAQASFALGPHRPHPF